jgi:hypothetical protein
MSLKPFPIDKFTDSAARASYARAHAARQAATTLEAMRDLNVGDTDPEEFFHFAANAFRDLGQLQRAAQCNFNSALLGHQKYQRGVLDNAAFATRSAGRSKAIFADLGGRRQSDAVRDARLVDAANGVGSTGLCASRRRGLRAARHRSQFSE